MKKAEKLILLAIVIVVGLIWYFGVREDFTSKAQIEALGKKLVNAKLENDPDIKSLNTQPAITGIAASGDKQLAVGVRYGFPLAIIAAFGDVQNDTFDVRASFIDSVLSGGFDTSKFTAANYIALIELATGNPIPNDEKQQLQKLEPLTTGGAKALYHSLTVGGCPNGMIPDVDKFCKQFQGDPNFSSAIKPWTQTEKDLLRKIAGKGFNIISDTPLAPPPGPTASMSGSAYSATCTKCLLVNNQLSCSCDVAPR